MKYTLNAKGQAAIVKWLGEIGLRGRPWDFFRISEQVCNNVSLPNVLICGGRELVQQPEWFDTAAEPATFDEVVAMLRNLYDNLGLETYACGHEVEALLARCPKG